jgi:prophage regulatory protein
MSFIVQSIDDIRLLRVEQVLEVVPVSRATLYRMIKQGEFPAPIHIGSLSVWPYSEVQNWVSRVKRRCKPFRADDGEEDII